MTVATTVNRWLVVLAVLVLVAAAALVWLLRDARAVGDVSSADAADATVVSSAVKDAVRERASAGAAAAYSYSWRSPATPWIAMMGSLSATD